MATNQVCDGNVIQWTNGSGSDVAAGGVAIVKHCIGVALVDIANGATGAVVPNFRRVELFGYPQLGWVRGTVDASDPELFRFEPKPWPREGRLR